MAYSPERLYLGVLRQERSNALPIKVGETKLEYLTRVLDKKISELNITDPKIREIAIEVITTFCSKRPIIVFFPIFSNKYKLNPKNETQKKGEDPVDLEHIMDNIVSTERFFTTSLGGMDSNNLGDLVDNIKIPSQEVGIIEIPDNFEIMQICATNRGMKKGELIDYFTGELINIQHQNNDLLKSQIKALEILKEQLLEEQQPLINEDSNTK